MLRLSATFLILFAAVAAVACDPFAPDLGDTPYRCGTDSDNKPTCPDGYEPVDVGQPTICECRVPGTNGNGPDAAPSGCANDPTEPNDQIADARSTPVGTAAMTVEFNNQDICTAADIDTFSFNTTQGNQKITATLQFNSAVGQLTLRIIDQSGTLLGAGPMPVGPTLVATATVPTSGKYYVQVYSSSGITTYGLRLQLQ